MFVCIYVYVNVYIYGCIGFSKGREIIDLVSDSDIEEPEVTQDEKTPIKRKLPNPEMPRVKKHPIKEGQFYDEYEGMMDICMYM